MKVISAGEAHMQLRAAFAKGKHDGQDKRWVPPLDDGRDWVLVNLPLDWVAPNMADARYDSTVDLHRARTYAASPGQFEPIHLLYGSRLQRRHVFTAAVMDGGHRVSAARMRGDTRILALMEQRDMERLLEARAAVSTPTTPHATEAAIDGCAV
ncbi:hypothetical protein [Burkholderia sp. Tr-20390]|uniref:hypothetical protein n=1 Tax=Burkholderia sp. Tr-20390 TaxID=2703904 RepID=UPI001F11F648|nr:hypothetical protein [Burkholderia sp. Tr-20390]